MLSLAVKPCAVGSIDRATDNQTHMARTRIRADATWIARSGATSPESRTGGQEF